MPSVTQASMPMARTPRTMSTMFFRLLLRPRISRQAAPRQKRVLPLSRATRAAARTDSTLSSRLASSPVPFW